MDALLLGGGRLVGSLGIVLMVVAAVGRLMGRFWFGGFQIGTLMLAGIGAVVVGCFLLLWGIAERRPR